MKLIRMLKRTMQDGSINTAVEEQKAVSWGLRRLLNWLRKSMETLRFILRKWMWLQALT